jgi:saccharopine dehydrogenase (NAD+, L-lysine-forming)
MTNSTWMLYGASGFTGRMIADEAIRRGHQPILAGRSAERIRPLAEALHLPWRVADLASPTTLREALQGVDAVLLAASPFQQTAPALVEACLATGTSYADIANEILHFRRLHRQDRAARDAGIALVPGVGFGVVATNCLARSVAEELPDAIELLCANHIASATSGEGATATGLEIIRGG